MDYSRYEAIVADELASLGHRPLTVHIAPDTGDGVYLHLTVACLGESKRGTTIVRDDLTNGWLRGWVDAWWKPVLAGVR